MADFMVVVDIAVMEAFSRRKKRREKITIKTWDYVEMQPIKKLRKSLRN